MGKRGYCPCCQEKFTPLEKTFRGVEAGKKHSGYGMCTLCHFERDKEPWYNHFPTSADLQDDTKDYFQYWSIKQLKRGMAINARCETELLKRYASPKGNK